MGGSEWIARMNRGPRDAHAAWLRRGRTGEGRLDLEGTDLSGGHESAALRGVELTAMRLVHCNLDDSVIVYGTLDESELVDCSGARARFCHSTFDRARLVGCRFHGADFRLARFFETRLEACDLGESWLVETPIVGAELVRCDLRGARIGDSQVDRSRFVECDLRGADLRLGSFESTRFERCDLRGARIDDRRLTDTAFVRCCMHGISGHPKPIARRPWQAPTKTKRKRIDATPIPPAYVLEDCDLSEAGDGSDVGMGDRLRVSWG